MKIQTKKIGIIGSGQVGSLLGKYCFTNNSLSWILARSEKRIEQLQKLSIPAMFIINSLEQIMELPDIIIICVNDNEIRNVIDKICKLYNNQLKAKIIFHTSGFLNRDILQDSANHGAVVGACHPYQTFFDNKIEILNGIGWGIDCDLVDFNNFADLIKFFGGNPIYLPDCTPEKKAFYHLSAVASSNFLSGVIQFAKQIALEEKINAIDFIPQIANQTLENSIHYMNNNEFPLTGPLARGDFKTIESHIKSLGNRQSLIDIYCHSALATLELSYINSIINPENYEKIKKLLKKYIS